MFKVHEHELGCSRCFQRRIWEQASDWLNSFVTEEKKQKSSDRLSSFVTEEKKQKRG